MSAPAGGTAVTVKARRGSPHSDTRAPCVRSSRWRSGAGRRSTARGAGPGRGPRTPGASTAAGSAMVRRSGDEARFPVVKREEVAGADHVVAVAVVTGMGENRPTLQSRPPPPGTPGRRRRARARSPLVEQFERQPASGRSGRGPRPSGRRGARRCSDAGSTGVQHPRAGAARHPAARLPQCVVGEVMRRCRTPRRPLEMRARKDDVGPRGSSPGLRLARRSAP